MDKCLFPMITEEERKLPFHVKSAGGHKSQDHISRPEGYTDYHWLHCIKGKGRLAISGNEYTISENMGFFFYPGIPHEYYALEEPWETHWITFNGHAVPSLLSLLNFRESEVFFISEIQRLDRLINNIYIAIQSENPFKGFECSSILYRFLIESRNCISMENIRSKTAMRKKLQPVVSYLEKNFHTTPSLEEIAGIINISPQHLCRLFRQTFDMRPFEYLTGLRIQKAKQLIMERGAATIDSISKNAGYNNCSYFCAVFKEYEGITPMEFKRIHRCN